jgi:hypothetical protein
MSTNVKIVLNSYRNFITTYQIESCDTFTSSLQYYEHKNIIETTLIFAISHKPQTQTTSSQNFRTNLLPSQPGKTTRPPREAATTPTTPTSHSTTLPTPPRHLRTTTWSVNTSSETLPPLTLTERYLALQPQEGAEHLSLLTQETATAESLHLRLQSVRATVYPARTMVTDTARPDRTDLMIDG